MVLWTSFTIPSSFSSPFPPVRRAESRQTTDTLQIVSPPCPTLAPHSTFALPFAADFLVGTARAPLASPSLVLLRGSRLSTRPLSTTYHSGQLRLVWPSLCFLLHLALSPDPASLPGQTNHFAFAHIRTSLVRRCFYHSPLRQTIHLHFHDLPPSSQPSSPHLPQGTSPYTVQHFARVVPGANSAHPHFPLVDTVGSSNSPPQLK